MADREGRIILDVNYAEITNLGESNRDGYIVRDDTGLYGIVDASKNVTYKINIKKLRKYMEMTYML